MNTLSKALLILTLIYGTTSHAFFGVPMRDAVNIEKRILTQVKQQLDKDGLGNFEVTNYRLDWTQKSFKCVQGVAEFLTEIQVGTCVITAKADGITAIAAIVKRDTGYLTTILTLETE
jgi:hypothetical protein